MFQTEAKLAERIQELSKYRYRDAISIAEFGFTLDEAGEIGSFPPAEAALSTIKVGEYWKGRDLYVWLSASLEVPFEWTGKKVLGRFNFGRTGGGNNSGFESLLFIDGAPYQGVDSNHEEVFLAADIAGQKIALTFRLWSGLEGGGVQTIQEYKLKQAELCWLDEAADDFFFTSMAALDTVKVLHNELPERSMLLHALDLAFRKIDWSYPGSEVFYGSVKAAREFFDQELAKIEKHHAVTVHCVGHTHIDVAWLWRLKHTREKSARSFSTVLRLMELFPDYVFLQTQPQLYEYVKNDYPQIYEQIRERVKEGRWEAAGGMWLEADCNLTSGESLVRQLLMGTRFLRDEFGSECKYLWLPDVFGYSWALPQILKKSGISTFMTTKISWNKYNRMPNDTFMWRGIDGTEVLTHFITTPEPVRESDSWFYTYNGEIYASTVKGAWDGYRNKDINRELLLSYGFGDGGGGVNREMLEMRRRLDRMPGIPHVKTGTAGEYFAKLEERVAETTSFVHTWDGELYLEYHRGTYTSQAYNKRMNRKLELLYRETEWLGVINSVVFANWLSYEQAQLNAGWKIILRNQFHDIIPGSSIREVYEDSRLEYEEAEQIARQIWNDAAMALTSGEETKSYTIFHSASWKRDDLVEIKAEEGNLAGRWTNALGDALESQLNGNQWIVAVPDLPSMGYTSLQFESGGEIEESNIASFTILTSGIRTPHYEIEWNSHGQLSKIFDLGNDREVLAAGARGNILQVFEDKPLNFDAWDIDLFYQQKMTEVSGLQSVEVIEQGPIRALICFKWTYMNSTIKQNMKVYAGSRRIDFETEIDWHERQRLLKVAFPVQVRSTEATYDIQYGNVKRPTHWNTSWDYARFETVGHQWADLSERGYGVSLLNDCKYGYDIKDNVMRLSLVKSAIEPDTEADQGHHLLTYSLLPHSGDWVDGNTVAEAWSLNNPVSYFQGAALKPEISLFQLSVHHIMMDAVKKAEDGEKAVVRIHEFSGKRNHARIFSDMSIHSWQECDLMELPTGEVIEETVISFSIDPYEIKTFLVEFK